MATPSITLRQIDIVAATALDGMANVYPTGSAPADAYAKLAAKLWSEIGKWTTKEYDEAFAAARRLPTPPPKKS